MITKRGLQQKKKKNINFVRFFFYYRIPCEYKNKNLLVEVVEWSQKPEVLAIKLVYQGGQTDILAVSITQVS